jgi:enoyl-CoA hydratase/carnithine racemase
VADPETVHVSTDDHILTVTVDRVDKRNAWDIDVIQGVARALTRLRDDDRLRVGLITAAGPDFTAGLDLPAVAPVIADGNPGAVLPPELVDPWDFMGEPCPKPVVVAVQGRCYTLGIELILASQIAVAAEDTVFAQLEVARGITPLGGATLRLSSRLGPAGLRYLLTAEEFDAATALELGLVTRVVPVGQQEAAARELAERIAANAPLAVQASLAQWRAGERAARDAAAQLLRTEGPALFATEDLEEAITAMMERRDPRFRGR